MAEGKEAQQAKIIIPGRRNLCAIWRAKRSWVTCTGRTANMIPKKEEPDGRE